MKTTTFNHTIYTILGVCLLLGLFSSCDKIKDAVSVNIPVKPAPIEFRVFKASPSNEMRSADGGEQEFFNDVLDVRLNHYLKENGFSFENVRSFNLMKVEVGVKSPENYDMSGFVGMKLYFGEGRDLVAEAKSVSEDKKTLILQVVTSQVDKYLDNDNLPILITGPNPVTEESVLLQMLLEFEARVTPL